MDFQTPKTVDDGHGRLEERTITVSSLLNDYLDWPSVQQVFKLERHFIHIVFMLLTLLPWVFCDVGGFGA